TLSTTSTSRPTRSVCSRGWRCYGQLADRQELISNVTFQVLEGLSLFHSLVFKLLKLGSRKGLGGPQRRSKSVTLGFWFSFQKLFECRDTWRHLQHCNDFRKH